VRGHLTKRSPNSWTMVLEFGRDPATGKRRQQWTTVKGPRPDAERKLAELLHQVDTGAFVKPTKLTLSAFLEQWLRDYAATNVRPRTFEGYRTVVRSQLVPKLGHIALAELRPAHLQAYYAKALTEGRVDGKPGGLSARSVLHHHRVLSEALSHAVKWGLVTRNVAKAVDPPRPERVEMNALDADGVWRLLEAAQGTPYHPMLHLAIYTGMRRSEILGLRWMDVDFRMATISVVQVMHRLRGGRIVFQEPKTQKGRRLVDLSPTAVLALRAHHERQEAKQDMLGLALAGSDLVFSQPDGSPSLPDTLSHAFAKIAARAGLPGVRLHDLRHTHATLMLRQGVHPKVVQERLGHSTIGVTLDTYSHVTPGLQRAAAMTFDRELEGSPEPAPLANR